MGPRRDRHGPRRPRPGRPARPASYAGTVTFDDFAVTPATGDSQAPTVAIVSPATGATLSGTVTVRATATDNVGVVQTALQVDGADRATGTVAPYQWALDTTTIANGTHTITVLAYDAAGNIGAASVTVTVQNANALPQPTIPQHLPNLRVAELAYTGTPIDATATALLKNSVDLVISDPQNVAQIAAVAPTTPQLIYTNLSTLYGSLLTGWTAYADANGIARESAFYHVSAATPYSGNSPSSQPVEWFWSVALGSGNSWTDLTAQRPAHRARRRDLRRRRPVGGDRLPRDVPRDQRGDPVRGGERLAGDGRVPDAGRCRGQPHGLGPADSPHRHDGRPAPDRAAPLRPAGRLEARLDQRLRPDCTTSASEPPRRGRPPSPPTSGRGLHERRQRQFGRHPRLRLRRGHRPRRLPEQRGVRPRGARHDGPLRLPGPRTLRQLRGDALRHPARLGRLHELGGQLPDASAGPISAGRRAVPGQLERPGPGVRGRRRRIGGDVLGRLRRAGQCRGAGGRPATGCWTTRWAAGLGRTRC